MLSNKRHNQKLQYDRQWKKYHDQAIDSNIKRYEENRKLTTGEDEDYINGCLLDYEYIKDHYRSIAVD